MLTHRKHSPSSSPPFSLQENFFASLLRSIPDSDPVRFCLFLTPYDIGERIFSTNLRLFLFGKVPPPRSTPCLLSSPTPPLLPTVQIASPIHYLLSTTRSEMVASISNSGDSPNCGPPPPPPHPSRGFLFFFSFAYKIWRHLAPQIPVSFSLHKKSGGWTLPEPFHDNRAQYIYSPLFV